MQRNLDNKNVFNPNVTKLEPLSGELNSSIEFEIYAIPQKSKLRQFKLRSYGHPRPCKLRSLHVHYPLFIQG